MGNKLLGQLIESSDACDGMPLQLALAVVEVEGDQVELKYSPTPDRNVLLRFRLSELVKVTLEMI